jgi:hypothetical protein
MSATDFYPVNQWTTVDPKKGIIDETTGRQYPYHSENELRAAAAGSILATPIVH